MVFYLLTEPPLIISPIFPRHCAIGDYIERAVVFIQQSSRGFVGTMALSPVHHQIEFCRVVFSGCITFTIYNWTLEVSMTVILVKSGSVILHEVGLIEEEPLSCPY